MKTNGLDIKYVKLTEHFKRQVAEKGFKYKQIVSALTNPEKVTEVRRYPGQLRYCGAGVAVVMRGNTAVTIYLDGIVTDIRPDQMNDPEAINSVRLNGKNK